MIFVDTNVFIDMLGGNMEWRRWSMSAMAEAKADGPVVTGPAVLAELARYAEDADELARLPGSFDVVLADWTVKASFLAGRAFQRHVARTGRGGAVLADFLIGGHAAALGAGVLTRDPKLLRRNFPELALITPD